nr:Chain A, CLAVATA-LIKE ENCODED PEPTIDE OF MELOIDOGYNE HAPLA - MHCLE6/7 [Meloidogyne hapla]
HQVPSGPNPLHNKK